MNLDKVQYRHCLGLWVHGNYASYMLSYSFIGQPVGWCISDRENTEVMQHFLQSLKDRSPSTVVSVLMTDDGEFKYHITKC